MNQNKTGEAGTDHTAAVEASHPRSRIKRIFTSPRVRRIWWWIIFCIYVFLGLCTIAAAYSGLINPEITAIPAILALTFPFWILLTVFLIIATVFVNWRLALVPGATLMICLGPVISNTPINFVKEKITPQNRDRAFMLLSYNCLNLFDARDEAQYPHLPGDGRSPVNPTLSYIIGSGADVVCLQEFPKPLKPNDRLRITSEQIDSLYSIYPHHTANYAETILSKYPLYPIPVKNPAEEYQPFQAAVMDIMGRKTLVVSVHLGSFGLDESDKALYREVTQGGGESKISAARKVLIPKLGQAFVAHAYQAEEIRHLVDSLNIRNVIIAGDFNDVPDCYAIRKLSGEDIHNAYSLAGHGPIITFHTNRFYFHIDHILYRGALEAIDFRRGDSNSSDHYPVTATFRWHPISRPDNHDLPEIDLENRKN